MLLLPLWLSGIVACTAPGSDAVETGRSDSGDSADSGAVRPEDADGDGFPAWHTTADASVADCDDTDSGVTPATEVYVPAGPFTRGREGLAYAEPTGSIHVSAYCIDRAEVTNERFLSLLQERTELGYPNRDDEGRPLFDVDDNDDIYPERLVESDGVWSIEEGYADHPVVEVWLWSADLYCADQGKRVPTEAQWEKAAKGADDARRWPWGDTPPDCARANFVNAPEGMPPTDFPPCVGDTTPVSLYASGVSPTGALGLAGNVSEWVADWFAPDGYATDRGEDPVGPPEGQLFNDGMGTFMARIARGGNFLTGPEQLETAARIAEPEDATSNGLGFRCVRALVE